MCILTASITGACQDAQAGNKAIWAIEFPALVSTVETLGVITTMTMEALKTFKGWKFIKDSAVMDSDTKKSVDNASIFETQKLSLKFGKFETVKRNEIRLISTTPLIIICLDNMGKYWLMGKTRGIDLVDSMSGSGGKMGDFNGFALNFLGDEPEKPVEINAATITALALPIV